LKRDHNLKEKDEPSRDIHLGKLVTNQDDAQFSILAQECSAAVSQQLQFPFRIVVMCCFQKQRSQTCSKPRARFLLVEKNVERKGIRRGRGAVKRRTDSQCQLGAPANVTNFLNTVILII